MKRFLSFILTLAVIASMFVLPTFAETTGTIIVQNAPKNDTAFYDYFKTETSILTHKGIFLGNATAWNTNGTCDDMFYDGKTHVIVGTSHTADGAYKYGKGIDSGNPEATKLATFVLDKTADVYIGVKNTWSEPTADNENIMAQWMRDEGYKACKNADGTYCAIYDNNYLGYLQLFKKTIYVPEGETASFDFYSMAKNVTYACTILVRFKDNPELTSSSYAFKGTSGEEGDNNEYYYVFSKISETFDGADYGIEVNGNWYSLVKEDGDKTEYNKALSSGYYGIGIADPSGSLGSVFNAIPQIRFNGGILFTGAPVSVNK